MYFARQQHDHHRQLQIGLINPTCSLKEAFNESALIVEWIDNQSIEDIKNLVLADKWEGIVYVAQSDSTGTNIQYYSTKQPSAFLQNQIRSAIQKAIVNEKLAVYGISNLEELFHSAESSISIENITVGMTDNAVTNQRKSGFYRQTLSMALGVMIYMFIILFASQVMRGVLEEKSNRIIELIITSISPVKFMAGKIIGIALVSLTQIICWIILMNGFMILLSNFIDLSSPESMNDFVNQRISQDDINQILNNLNQTDFNAIVLSFVFFSLGGYLLYSSIFAAIAAAASHGDDIQRLTMIVTLPLILSIIVLSNTAHNPDSSLSYWFSIIPFTSPVIMMGRIVYGAPIQDILLSMFLLTITIAFVIWLSGRIYKTAILYTGKKITGKDIFLWVRNINN
jgi:ABC-2 type transport system permease protein